MRGRWTPKWVMVHIAVVVVVAVFLRLGWWQVTRAADGNLLSYGYALQWPAFAVFVVYVWIKEMRLAGRPGSGPASSGPRSAATKERGDEGPDDGDARKLASARRPAGPEPRASEASAEDAELVAYNRYLAWLNAHPEASPRDYPG